MKLQGIITDFSDARGDGHLRTDEGELLYFHCVTIADGSRHVDAGARVVATRRVGLRGRDEATAIALA
jgi:cold shock CspA family protein